MAGRHLPACRRVLRALCPGALLAISATPAAAFAVAPSVPIFGSYFPVWIICAVLGVIAAVIGRQLFIFLGLDEFLPLRLLVYLCLAIGSALAIWFFWFGGVVL
ncbi:YtcA family lipoprotein [Aminobacter sp. HY435]|uniref:YtcA family lipoprotein n=1 Tax=Aminobacter sp. HY435 TaxID=2970917 RepID=UPI0022B9C23C|nr:YtcA family lipoprotein [Aminobacter sp. HY435]